MSVWGEGSGRVTVHTNQEKLGYAAIISHPPVSVACHNTGLVPTHTKSAGFSGSSPPHAEIQGPGAFHLPTPPPQHEAHTAARQKGKLETCALALKCFDVEFTHVTSAHIPSPRARLRTCVTTEGGMWRSSWAFGER